MDEEVVVHQIFTGAAHKAVDAPAAFVDNVEIEVQRNAHPVLVVVDVCFSLREAVRIHILCHEGAAEMGVADTGAHGPAGVEVE